MPEGDTIHYAANRIRPILAGRVPELRTPHPRLRGDRWPDRLGGREVTAVDAHGKHLFLHFEGDLVIHSHLRMTGSWGTYRAGQRWRRSPAARLARDVRRRPRGRAVRRAGPRAHDGVAQPLRPAHRGPGPGHHQGALRRGARPAPAARGGPDPADRRRAAAAAGRRRHRQPLEGRGLLGGEGRSVATGREGGRRRGAGDPPRTCAADAAVRAATGCRTSTAWSTARRAGRARAAGRASPSAGSGRTTARRSGAPGASGEARRPQGRGPPRPREHARRVRRRDGRRGRHARVRRAARRGRRDRRAVPRARLHRPALPAGADARGGPRAPRRRRLRGRGARRGPQAARLRGPRDRGPAPSRPARARRSSARPSARACASSARWRRACGSG